MQISKKDTRHQKQFYFRKSMLVLRIALVLAWAIAVAYCCTGDQCQDQYPQFLMRSPTEEPEYEPNFDSPIKTSVVKNYIRLIRKRGPAKPVEPSDGYVLRNWYYVN
ncbi:uncharacterized protein LOC111706030 [Eurytemora carolleeae]|uniref:uncharacterized protein LOC111706030 n=1 Tax=Eurytemora carolleeae TaxID=1294199 RepID=UPI000C757323|nr:uncharacterized protein LOC111706030 [Eurytemora carolleeae]|eukprot:XP_023334550.1 uncharacterized protein LOC111706030 [Eurytemora affinis]